MRTRPSRLAAVATSSVWAGADPVGAPWEHATTVAERAKESARNVLVRIFPPPSAHILARKDGCLYSSSRTVAPGPDLSRTLHVRGSMMATRTHGSMAVDWEQRIDFDRLRRERLERAKALLRRSELGALLCFDMNNVRYLTATHIG